MEYSAFEYASPDKNKDTSQDYPSYLNCKTSVVAQATNLAVCEFVLKK